MTKLVLHVLCSGNYSGAEKMALQLIGSYTSEYRGIYFAEHGIIDRVDSIPKIVLNLVDKVNYGSLFRIVNELKPDVIHAHDFRASILSAALPFNIKIVSQIHQNPSWFFRLNPLSIAYYISCFRYSKIIFVGDWFKKNKLYIKFFGNKSCTIENCVDARVLDLATISLNNDVQAFDILFLGRLSNEKDPIKFINIAVAILKCRPETTLKIVGDGPLKEQCNQLMNDLQLSDSIEMVGFSDCPYKYIASAKVLINTSKHEGFGLVAVEANLLGKPCISGGVGGLASIYESNSLPLCSNDSEYIEKCLDVLDSACSADKYLVDKDEIHRKYCNVSDWMYKFIALYQ